MNTSLELELNDSQSLELESPLKQLLIKICTINKIPLKNLAKETGLSPSTLRKILSGERKSGSTTTYIKLLSYYKRAAMHSQSNSSGYEKIIYSSNFFENKPIKIISINMTETSKSIPSCDTQGDIAGGELI